MTDEVRIVSPQDGRNGHRRCAQQSVLFVRNLRSHRTCPSLHALAGAFCISDLFPFEFRTFDVVSSFDNDRQVIRAITTGFVRDRVLKLRFELIELFFVGY